MSSLSVPGSVAGRRSSARHTSMFLRMMVRAAILRRGRAVSALLAMVVAAAAATAMLDLYVDVQAKLRREFRNYGANIVVVGKSDAALSANSLPRVRELLGARGTVVPVAYVVARTASGQSIIVSGTDFAQARTVNHWWSVSTWPSQANDALVGVRALSAAGSRGAFDLSFRGRTIHLNPVGTLQTGAAEDSRIYLSLNDFTAWTGVQPSTLEISVAGSSDEVAVMQQKLQQALPSADVRPVRQIVEAEGRVLGKTRSMLLASAVLIILTAALCVLATLIGWVFDRRRDFAMMKALGASERLLNGFFAAEAAALGAVGAVLGFGLGVGIAALIGRVNFHAPVALRLGVFPAVFLGAVAVALLSALIPISMLRRVQPATILRGE